LSDEVHISQEEVDRLLRDEEGPVGNLMREFADQIASVAREKVPVRIPRRFKTGRTSSARAPGYTRANIASTVGHAKTHDDILFGGADAPEDPGLFLELPAKQIHEKHPFLTTGLESIWVG